MTLPNSNIQITPCFCIWSDLLGFGAAFHEASWTFAHEAAQRNIERLHRVSKLLSNSNDPGHEVALLLNDGLARVYDLPENQNDAEQFLWWLHSAIINHWMINAVERSAEQPGLRSVISFGERVSLLPDQKSWGDHFQGDGPMKRSADKKVCVYSPREFQLNLAFSKAYIIESAGSKAGMVGPYLFVDEAALNGIESYLQSKNFEIIVPTSIEETAEGGAINLSARPLVYEVSRAVRQECLRFDVIRCTAAGKSVAVSLTFDPQPIAFSMRGIETNVYKLRGFKPMDDDKLFDLQHCEFCSVR